MRALLQRVSRACVRVNDQTIASIGRGLVVFLGVCKEDGHAEVDRLVEKLPLLRIFDDAEGKMNVGAMENGAEFLVVSQFTLYANCREGRRPSFDRAAAAEHAKPLYEEFLKRLAQKGVKVQNGSFGEHMRVELENEGPVTLWVDTND